MTTLREKGEDFILQRLAWSRLHNGLSKLNYKRTKTIVKKYKIIV